MPNVNSHALARETLIGVLMVFVSAIAFSAKAIFVKLAYAYSVDALTMMALRMLIAAPFFVVMAVWASHDRTSPALSLRDWGSIVALGLAGMYLSQLFDFLGLEHVSAGLERTILFLYPTFVVVISAFLASKAIGKREIMALILSYAGIILVATHEITFVKNTDTLLGAGLVFISALTYASYMVGSGPTMHKVGTQRFTGYTMIVACVAALTHFSATHSLTSLVLPRQVYLFGFFMAIVSTVLPVVLLNMGIKKVGGSKASLIGSVGPVSTVLLAAFFLNEVITVKQIIGTGFVLAGVLIITVPQSIESE